MNRAVAWPSNPEKVEQTMTSMTRSTGAAAMLFAVFVAGAANATYYSITGGGGQLQFGVGTPIPLQPPQTTMITRAPIGTGTKFPPLLIPVNPDPRKALVRQTGSNPASLTVAPGALLRAPAAPKTVFDRNAQIRTKFSFSGPAAKQGTRTFKKNGWRTAPVSFPGVPSRSARVFYSGSTNRFGGRAQIHLGAQSQGRWIHPGAKLPCKHPDFGGLQATCVAQKVVWKPASLVAAGGGIATGGGHVTKGVVVTTPGGTTMPGTVDASITLFGHIAQAKAAVKTLGGVDNKATSVGFPWTTGRVELSQPSAIGAYEKFTITGKDSRTAKGSGTISLVAGALSDRNLPGPQANRAWMRFQLPEPDAALGAAAALAVLALCHGLVRRSTR
jgi:hypothetical protein